MQYYDKQEISKKFLAEQAEKAQLLLATAGHCAGMDILEQIMTITITHTK